MLPVVAQDNVLEDIELLSYDSKCKDGNDIVGGVFVNSSSSRSLCVIRRKQNR